MGQGPEAFPNDESLVSRRAVVAGGSLGAMSAVGYIILPTKIREIETHARCEYSRRQEFPYAYSKIDSYKEGFVDVPDLKEDLIKSAKFAEIDGEPLPTDDGVLYRARFELNDPTYLILQADGFPNPLMSLQALDVRLFQGEFDESKDPIYYHPILATDERKTATTSFHEKPAGIYTLEIRSADQFPTLSASDLNVKIKSVDTKNEAFKKVIDNIPNVHLRPDNLTRVTHNMPVINPWSIKEKDGIYLVEYNQLLLGQDGGTNYCRAKRPEDYETYFFLKMNEKWKIIERAGQEGRHHNVWIKTENPYAISDSRLPTDLQIETNNNIPTIEPDEFTNRIVCMFDEFLELSVDEAEARYNALQANAFNERYKKGDLDKNLKLYNVFQARTNVEVRS